MKTVLKNFQDIVVEKFVQKLLIIGYNNYSIPENIPLNIVKVLKQNYKISITSVLKQYNKIPEIKNKNSVFWKGRKKYSIGKFRHLQIFKLVKKWITGEIVLEIGCGENYLGSIAIKNSSIKKYIGTDIYINKQILKNKKIEFRKQTKPLEIPIKNKSVDSLLIIDMIHHVDRKNQKKLLQNAFQKLKQGGKMIIIEYTFSEKKYVCKEKITNEFNKLSNKKKFMIMSIIDWIGNNLIIGRKINMPYAYRTMEEWEQLFKKIGFQLIKSKYLGILIKLFHPGPYSLFILKK